MRASPDAAREALAFADGRETLIGNVDGPKNLNQLAVATSAAWDRRSMPVRATPPVEDTSQLTHRIMKLAK